MYVEFYIGIDPEDTQDFLDFCEFLNEQPDPINHVTVINEFDNTEGYYTYSIHGTWAAYNKFNQCRFVKSIEHFEED